MSSSSTNNNNEIPPNCQKLIDAVQFLQKANDNNNNQHGFHHLFESGIEPLLDSEKLNDQQLLDTLRSANPSAYKFVRSFTFKDALAILLKSKTNPTVAMATPGDVDAGINLIVHGIRHDDAGSPNADQMASFYVDTIFPAILSPQQGAPLGATKSEGNLIPASLGFFREYYMSIVSKDASVWVEPRNLSALISLFGKIIATKEGPSADDDEDGRKFGRLVDDYGELFGTLAVVLRACPQLACEDILRQHITTTIVPAAITILKQIKARPTLRKRCSFLSMFYTDLPVSCKSLFFANEEFAHIFNDELSSELKDSTSLSDIVDPIEDNSCGRISLCLESTTLAKFVKILAPAAKNLHPCELVELLSKKQRLFVPSTTAKNNDQEEEDNNNENPLLQGVDSNGLTPIFTELRTILKKFWENESSIIFLATRQEEIVTFFGRSLFPAISAVFTHTPPRGKTRDEFLKFTTLLFRSINMLLTFRNFGIDAGLHRSFCNSEEFWDSYLRVFSGIASWYSNNFSSSSPALYTSLIEALTFLRTLLLVVDLDSSSSAATPAKRLLFFRYVAKDSFRNGFKKALSPILLAPSSRKGGIVGTASNYGSGSRFVSFTAEEKNPIKELFTDINNTLENEALRMSLAKLERDQLI